MQILISVVGAWVVVATVVSSIPVTAVPTAPVIVASPRGEQTNANDLIIKTISIGKMKSSGGMVGETVVSHFSFY